MKNIGRRTFLRGVGLSGLGLAATACGAQGSTAPSEVPAANPDEALQRLVEGNQRFVSGKVRHPNLTSARLTEVSQGQKPFACVLGCADSRVSPELIFDRGLGDIFVVRSAGNIADPVAIGSLEYGVAVLGTKVLLVLGHERCGAVAETLKGEAPGSIQALIDAIKPAVAASQGQSGDPLDNAVIANVKYQMGRLFEQSTILSDAVKAGTLKIVGGRYDLDKGELTLIG